MSRAASVTIVIMAIVIAVLAWLLWTERASAPTTTEQQFATSTKPAKVSTSSASHAMSFASLDTKVVVNSPKSGSTVSHNLMVSGEAPGNWFFEAVFPIMVRDKDDNVIGRTQGKAEGDWMTTGQVKFTAQVFIDQGYHGPATLILMRDNPSGLPENDDSVEIPITIK